jgi:hypothetical protein
MLKNAQTHPATMCSEQDMRENRDSVHSRLASPQDAGLDRHSLDGGHRLHPLILLRSPCRGVR